MTQLKELRQQAKAQGMKGYSVMKKDDLILALQGKPVPKKLRKNQISVGTQTDFEVCDKCSLQRFVTHLKFEADRLRLGYEHAEMGKIVYEDDLEIDEKTGEVCGYEVDYVRY
uniref:Rho termination factor-like N-terminal domain-containing protein n=1 Tax=Clytia hemisphaerica TaxID=252671 RepID=A0A7M5XGG5_9CNID